MAAKPSGPAASLDPRARLACLALLSTASLMASWHLAAGFALVFIALLRLSGIGVVQILKESSFIAVFALVSVSLRFLGGQAGTGSASVAAYASVYALKLFAAFLAGRLFYSSTSSSEMRDSITRIVRRLPLLRRFDLGMGLSLVLGYLPLIFQEWKDSIQAARARGLSRFPDPTAAALFVASFLRRLILKSIALPQALEARGWCRDRGLAPMAWRLRDSACLILSIIACLCAALRLV